MTSTLQQYRYQAATAQNWRCYYCGFPMGGPGSPYQYALADLKRALESSAEYLLARGDGGADGPENIVAAHALCNCRRHRRKTKMSPETYHQHVQKRVEAGGWFEPSFLARFRSVEDHSRQARRHPGYHGDDASNPSNYRDRERPKAFVGGKLR